MDLSTCNNSNNLTESLLDYRNYSPRPGFKKRVLAMFVMLYVTVCLKKVKLGIHNPRHASTTRPLRYRSFVQQSKYIVVLLPTNFE